MMKSDETRCQICKVQKNKQYGKLLSLCPAESRDSCTKHEKGQQSFSCNCFEGTELRCLLEKCLLTHGAFKALRQLFKLIQVGN